MLEEDLRALLLTGPGIPPRVYWVQRPQGAAMPDIVLTRITGLPDYHMQGPSGLVQSRVQADVWTSSTYAEAKGIARALAALLSGYRGTIGATRFQMIQIDGERDFFDAGSNDAERFYRVSVDLLIHHHQET
jgi:hypothetical protein